MLATEIVRSRTHGDVSTAVMTAGFVGAAATALVLASTAHAPSFATVPTVALAVLAAAGEFQSTRVTSRLQVSATAPLIVLAAVVGGPVSAVLVALAALLADPTGPAMKWISHAAMFVCMGTAGGLAVEAAGGVAPTGLGAVTARAAIAAAAGFVVNITACVVIGWVRRINPLGAFLRTVVATTGMGCVLAVPIVAALGYGYTRAGVPVLLLSLIPLLGVSSLFRLYRDKVALALRLSEGNMAFAMSLVRALDARDSHTAGHSAAVAVYARDIAKAKGLPESEIAKVQLAALLHDIGKIGVPTEVLNKDGELEDHEWEAIRAHPEIGAQIAGEAPVFAEISRFIRHHHERPDGRGYPEQLVGDRIPLASAIIGVADAYNAMTSCRPYRTAMAPEEAMVELRRGAGSQFDAHLVEVFLTVLEAQDALYQVGEGDRFSLDGQRTALFAELGGRRLVGPSQPAAAVA